jgi:hypothetical protein
VSEIQFFQTAMGRQFIERTVPELVRELTKLNANLERLAAAMERPPDPLPPAEPKHPSHDHARVHFWRARNNETP